MQPRVRQMPPGSSLSMTATLILGFASIMASTTVMTDPVPTAMTSYSFIRSPEARAEREPLMPSVPCTMSSSDYTKPRDGSCRRRGTRERVEVDDLTVAGVKLGLRLGLPTTAHSLIL